MGRRVLCPAPLLASVVLCTATLAAPDPKAVLEQIRSATLDPARAVNRANVTIDMGLGTLHLEQGWLVPARAVEGHTAEMVFVGHGRFRIEPPDAIEASQLELFTGERSLDLEIERAVLVLGDPSISETLLRRDATTPIEESQSQAASEVFAAWVASPERRGIGADTAILRTTLGDLTLRRYFTAVFDSPDRGRFFYLLDPTELEQITLGQFVPLEIDDRDRYRIERDIRRDRKSGRSVNTRLEDLGDWDTWLQTSLRGADAVAQPGSEDFEPTHYVIDATLLPGEERIEATTRVEITAQRAGARTVSLSLFSDLKVSQVGDAAGKALPWFQSAGSLYVILPEALAAGAKTQVEVRFTGVLLEEFQKGILRLRTTRTWHPHVGTFDRATYDVTLRWPKRYELLASGRAIETREEAGQTIERRLLDVPAIAFTFEIGAFEIVRETVGHVALTVGFSKIGFFAEDAGAKKDVLDALRSALPYYEETFGPYPFDHLTVATVPRGASQGFLSFLTLSHLLLGAPSGWYYFLDPTGKTAREQRVEVVAHELAHQWWGNKVGWYNYRDQWLSEALADFSAVHYAASQADHTSVYLQTHSREWRAALQDTTEDGRTVESLGPVVLGERLFSSLSSDAYTAIVYSKGSVVFSMLAAILKPDKMNEMLRELATRVGNRAIDTATFVKALERMSGFDLSTFADQFIYGTGVPEVYYSYDVRNTDPESWVVEGEARLFGPPNYRYTLTSDEGWDVTRRRVDTVDISDWALLVPFQVAVSDSEEQVARGATVTRGLGGNVVLRGASTPFSIPLKRQPEEFWLDQRGQVLAYFFCESREPKRMLLHRALQLEGQAAAELLERALRTPLLSEAARAKSELSEKEIARRERLIDSRILVELARLHLDRRDPAAAKASLSSAEQVLPNLDKRYYKSERSYLGARIALQEGRYDAAFGESRTLRLSFPYLDTDSLGQDLRRSRWRDGRSGHGEDYAVLAVAAYETGRLLVARRAMEEAEDRGAEMGPLRALLGAPPDSLGD
jgi:hypothetical protein